MQWQATPDRPSEASSLPVLYEMARDALLAFGNYEQQKGGMTISTQTALGTINDVPAVSVVIVAVYPVEKAEAAIAEALRQTLEYHRTQGVPNAKD